MQIPVDWSGLLVLVLVALIVELFFEWFFDLKLIDAIEEKFRQRFPLSSEEAIKPLIVFAAALVICATYRLDFVVMVLGVGNVHWIGIGLAAGAVSAGSKRIMRLFRDWAEIGRVSQEAKKHIIRKRAEVKIGMQ